MNTLWNGSVLTSKVTKIVTLLKKEGLVKTGQVVSSILLLKLQIRMLSPNKTVSLDGCSFPLRDIPNTFMKLHLLRGTYETPERSAAQRYVKPEWPVVELGGCIGVVACITNKLLSQPNRHVVVEANPFAIAQLEANRALNQCSFSVVNRALAYDSPSVRLMPSVDLWGTSLYDRGEPRPYVDVPATKLEDLVKAAEFESFALICDIEGQEYELIRNELGVLSRAEVIIMEVHPDVLGDDKVSEMFSALGKAGFTIAERMATVVVMSKAKDGKKG